MQPIVTLTMNPALDIATATDRVVPTHKLRCAAPRYDPGGGGINVARAVHALGGALLGPRWPGRHRDMVLLDDNFASLVGGIEEGRARYFRTSANF